MNVPLVALKDVHELQHCLMVTDRDGDCIIEGTCRWLMLSLPAIAVLCPSFWPLQETLKSCNNACWALGEMALRLPPDMLQQSGMAGGWGRERGGRT